MQRHERQHRCDFPDCTNVNGFATEYDLRRHKRSVHKEGKVFFCHVDGCSFALGGPKGGFPRLDKLRDHVRCRHQTSAPVSTFKPQAQISSGSTSVPSPVNGRLAHTEITSVITLPVTTEALHSHSRKRRRPRTARESTESHDLTSDSETEVSRLRRIVKERDDELERQKKELVKLRKVVKIMTETGG